VKKDGKRWKHSTNLLTGSQNGSGSMTDKRRYDDLKLKEKNCLVADIIAFLEDDGSMNGKTNQDLFEAFPDYNEGDLRRILKALVDVRAVYQNKPYRSALYIAFKTGSQYAKILREG